MAVCKGIEREFWQEGRTGALLLALAAGQSGTQHFFYPSGNTQSQPETI